MRHCMQMMRAGKTHHASQHRFHQIRHTITRIEIKWSFIGFKIQYYN
jgi:hypothetical protein